MTVTRMPPRTFMPSAPVAGAEAPQHASRHARAVPSIRRNDANQVGAPTPRQTQPTNGAPAPAPASSPAPAAETDKARGLLANLSSSQNKMVEYRDTLPAASDVVKETVAEWFQKKYPHLAATLGKDWPYRLTVLSQPGGPGTPVIEAPLADLPWEPLWGEGRMPLQGMSVVHTRADGSSTLPRELNTDGALHSMTGQLQTSQMGDTYRTRQASYWAQPGIIPGKTRAESLAFEFGAQLRSEAALRQDDGTLSADGLQTVEDVLASPDMSTRRRGQGPGIHRLMVEGRPQPGAFVLTQRDNEKDPGAVLLWQPGRPLQEFSNVQEMRAWAAADRNIPEASVQTLALLDGTRFESRLRVPVTTNLFETRVNDLRDESDRQFERTLREKPPAGQTWASQMDAATDAGPYLDLSPAIQARRDLKDAEAYRQWLTSDPDTAALKQEWHEKFSAYAKLAADYQKKAKDAPADYIFQPERYGDEARVRQYASETLRKELAATGKDVDPDTTYLQFSTLPPSRIGGFHQYAGKWDNKAPPRRISLTDWALRNADYTQKVGIFRDFSYPYAKLVDAQGKKVSGLTVDEVVAAIRKVDVGATYPAHLKTTLLDAEAGETSAHHYATLQQARLRAELPATLLDEEDKTTSSVAPYRSWIEAVIDAPDAANRNPVNGRPIEVKPLRLGHSIWTAPEGTTSPVQGAWVIQPRGSGADRPLILMTPGAPDGRTFRRFQSTTHMQDSLNADPGMRQYLASRVGPAVGTSVLSAGQTYATSADNAKTILGAQATWVSQAPEEKGNFLRQEYEDGVKFSIERAGQSATSTVDADNNRTDGILRWAGDLMLSTAAPIVSVPYTLGRIGMSIFDGANSAREGDHPQAAAHFLDAFGRIADLVPAPSAKTGSAASRLTPLRHLPEARPGVRAAQPTTVPGIAPMPRRGHATSSAADDIGVFRGPDAPVGRDVIPAEVQDWKLTDSTIKGRLVEGSGDMGPGHRSKYRDPVTRKEYLKLNGDYYPSEYRNGNHVIYDKTNAGPSRVVTASADGLVVQNGGRLLGGGKEASKVADPSTSGFDHLMDENHDLHNKSAEFRSAYIQASRRLHGDSQIKSTLRKVNADVDPGDYSTSRAQAQKRHALALWEARAKTDPVRPEQYDFNKDAPVSDYSTRQLQLQEDAQSFYDHQAAFPPQKVVLDKPVDTSSPSTMFDSIYRDNKVNGIVIGETHGKGAEMDSIAAHKFIRRSIPDLQRNGVKTVYVEGPPTEAKGMRDIRDAWERIKAGERNVKVDRSSIVDEEFADLVDALHEAGIEIKSIDNMASMQYKITRDNGQLSVEPGGLLEMTHQPPEFVHPGQLAWEKRNRLSLHNYYATVVIQTDQKANPGKWLALQGKRHVTDHRGIPGTARLNGAVALDFNYDPGKFIPEVKATPGAEGFEVTVSSSDVVVA